MKIDKKHLITEFYEKPQDPAILEHMRCPKNLIEKMHLSTDATRCYLGSMGIYLFKRKALIDLLTKDLREDFGKHLLPTLMGTGKAAAYLYDGYWEDIGTIETFYQANLSLTDTQPLFSFHDEKRPIYTTRYDLPPAKFSSTQLHQTILCEGSIVEAASIVKSLLGPRSVVQQGSVIQDSYLMGNDYYFSSIRDHHHLPNSPHVGKNCLIKKAIIDKNVEIGDNVQLINKNQLSHYNDQYLFVRDGIIIIPRGTTIPDDYIF